MGRDEMTAIAAKRTASLVGRMTEKGRLPTSVVGQEQPFRVVTDSGRSTALTI